MATRILHFISLSLLLLLLHTTVAPNQTNQNNNSISVKPRLHEYYIDPSLPIRLLNDFKINFNGYIKYEAFWDSRQVIGLQDDQLLFAPQKKDFDEQGNDRNAKGQFNMVPFETRVRMTVNGPDVRKAKSTGVIEADFWGKIVSGTEVPNVYRIRHAFLRLDWEKLSFIAGQTWHPIYILGCYPDTISFNGGDPIEPFSRNPQARLTIHATKSLDVILAAMSQTDFRNDGPEGFSTTYTRNAIVPNLHGQVQKHFGDHMIGAGIDYKRLVPRIQTKTGLKVRESINSIATIGFACLSWPSFTANTKISYAQNGANFDMLGGFAVAKPIEEQTDKRTYTNLSSVSWWTDFIITKKKDIEPGLFIGYIKNLGSNKEIVGNVTDEEGNITERRIFGAGNDIDNVFRLAPRLRWHIKKTTIAGELEYTRAAFGTIDNKGKVKNAVAVGNLRFLFAIFYHF